MSFKNPLTSFINSFNFNKPDWSQIPKGFPKLDLEGLTSEEVGKFLGIQTLWELAKPPQPTQSSRVWKHPQGFKYLVQWSNAVLLRYLGRQFTNSLPKSEYRRKAQLDDCLRSVVRNIEEGFKRSTTSEYSQFLGYSQGSLEEGKGDFKDLAQDGFLPSKPGSSLTSIGIDLKSFNVSLASSSSPISSFQSLGEIYPPLAKIQASDLTYEIFLELINKTDYLLRVLVQSLEKKLNQDQKAYQVDRLRIKGKL